MPEPRLDDLLPRPLAPGRVSPLGAIREELFAPRPVAAGPDHLRPEPPPPPPGVGRDPFLINAAAQMIQFPILMGAGGGATSQTGIDVTPDPTFPFASQIDAVGERQPAGFPRLQRRSASVSAPSHRGHLHIDADASESNPPYSRVESNVTPAALAAFEGTLIYHAPPSVVFAEHAGEIGDAYAEVNAHFALDPCTSIYLGLFHTLTGYLSVSEQGLRNLALTWISVLLRLCPQLHETARAIRDHTTDGNVRSGLTSALKAPWPCALAVQSLKEIRAKLKRFKYGVKPSKEAVLEYVSELVPKDDLSSVRDALDTIRTWKCWGYAGRFRRFWTQKLDQFRDHVSATLAGREGTAPFSLSNFDQMIEFIESETNFVSGYDSGE